MVPAPTVRVTPALIVSVPVTLMREFAGHVVFAAIAPVTSVKTGAASMLFVGFAVTTPTAPPPATAPAVVFAAATTEPQPRRICAVVPGKPENVTRPLRR